MPAGAPIFSRNDRARQQIVHNITHTFLLLESDEGTAVTKQPFLPAFRPVSHEVFARMASSGRKVAAAVRAFEVRNALLAHACVLSINDGGVDAPSAVSIAVTNRFWS